MTDVPGSTSSTSLLGEREPLLGNGMSQPAKKPFHRARPLWLVPFVVVASLTRGMTMAPRIEVYTRLACVSIHPLNEYQDITNLPGTVSLSKSLYKDVMFTESPSAILVPQNDAHPTRPFYQCVTDPAVQKEAARIQTVFTTTMGLLSALSTGWWGHFSERYGRTRVLALSTLGLFLTDLAFIVVATPGSPLATHAYKILVIAPLIEGSLGGWSTLHSATSAYVSDCTSPGSRATIFSRFMGIIFLGSSLGPIIGGWVIRNGIPGIERIGTVTQQGKSVTEVFWLAISLSFINFFLMTFLLPESLSKEQQAKVRATYQADVKGKSRSSESVVGEASTHGDELTVVPKSSGLMFNPLALFLPVVIEEGTAIGIRKRRDWSLTFLALAMFLYMLSTGIYQIKHLYALHTYSWAPDELSYYISFLAALRATALLFLLPCIISIFKPKSPPAASPNTVQGAKQSKLKPTKAHLASEMKFDLLLARSCIFIDLLSPFLILVIPAPDAVHHMGIASPGQWIRDPTKRNMALFVFASGLGSIGSGFLPTCQSVALCTVQARQLIESTARENHSDGDENREEHRGEHRSDTSIGKLFGALSTLQAVGQMILGPMLFGLLYGNTVAFFPKAIFVVGGGILATVLLFAFLVRNPVEGYLLSQQADKGKMKYSQGDDESGDQRGRSRTRKHLFGYRMAVASSRERSNFATKVVEV